MKREERNVRRVSKRGKKLNYATSVNALCIYAMKNWFLPKTFVASMKFGECDFFFIIVVIS
jgi:hypothetical protein